MCAVRALRLPPSGHDRLDQHVATTAQWLVTQRSLQIEDDSWRREATDRDTRMHPAEPIESPLPLKRSRPLGDIAIALPTTRGRPKRQLLAPFGDVVAHL
eukprot:616599-Prorocentrum_minimum.AAC.1